MSSTLEDWNPGRVMPTMRGMVRLSKLASHPCTVRPGPRIQIISPGLDISIDPGRVTHVHSETAFVAVHGSPTLDGVALNLERDVGKILPNEVETWSRWRGRFSVVYVDLEQRAVHFVTDKFSVHPICWGVQDDRVFFSDRADTVHGDEASEIDRQALFHYLYFHVIPADRTIFHNIRRVGLATAVSITVGGSEARRYWRPNFDAVQRIPFQEKAAQFRQMIRNSVERSRVLDGKIGCFLSGGTDSSTVLGMLAESAGAPVAAFSVGFDVSGYDEIEYARIAARRFGAKHEVLYVSPSDLLAAIPAVAGHFDQPFGNSSAVPAYLCSALARSQGVSLMLAGDGGDELFGGNQRYAKQGLFDLWTRVPNALRGGLESPTALRALRGFAVTRKLASYIEQARVPMPARMETYNLLERFGAERVLSPDLLSSVDQAEPALLQRLEYEHSEGSPLIDRMLAYDWCFTLADNDLHKVNGAASLAGVDVAFPFLDEDLLDFSLTLTPEEKLKGTRLRPFFKDALRGFLPDDIIAKKKHGFGLPFGAWAVSNSALREFARDSVAGLEERGVVRAGFVDEVFGERLSSDPGYYGEMAWILMVLEQWLRVASPRFRIA